ncbi:hypothetical protein D3C75_376600 [compost metagenome]
MTRKRSGLRRDPFHKVTITTNSISIVVNYVMSFFVVGCAQLSFGHSHTNGHTNTLSKRTCSCINTSCVTNFRVTRSQATPLTELFQFFHRKIIAAKVQQAVQKHGTMSSGQYKTIAVYPCWMIRVMIHCFCKQLVAHWCRTHWHTWMAGIRFFDSINSQRTNCCDRQVIYC